MHSQDKKFIAQNFVIAALNMIDQELRIMAWNLDNDEYVSPFDNTTGSISTSVFSVEAYSLDETYDQPYNFKYKDIEISWCKYMATGNTFVNREVTPQEIADMLDDCLDHINLLEEEGLKE